MNTLGRKKHCLILFSTVVIKTLAKKIAWEGDSFILQYLGHNPSMRELKIGILRQEL